MSVPANINAELVNLQSQVVTNSPLTAASHANIVAMQLNAANLVADVQTALTASNNLDNFTFAIDPITITNQVNAISQTAEDQSDLSLLRGITGRVASNLDQY